MHMTFLEVLLEGRFGLSISKELSSDANAGLRNAILVIKDQESMGLCLYMVAVNCCGAVLVA